MLDGSLELEFCAAPARGSVRVLPEYEVELEPNPVIDDVLKLKFKSSGDIDRDNIVVDVDIFDISGNCVLEDRIILNKSEQEVNIDLSGISSGSYLIRFVNPFSPTITHQFLLVR